MSACEAQVFAIRAHGDQKYGSGLYCDHLQAVVHILADFGYHGAYENAGWLHDVVEDTPITGADIRKLFGDWVADAVNACTGVGRNRKERNASIYDKIARFPEAAPIKVADRIANVENAAPGSSHAGMYAKEAMAFHASVARHAPAGMQKRLALAYYSNAQVDTRP